jgi:DNA-binding NarL/FixJ family response regulator
MSGAPEPSEDGALSVLVVDDHPVFRSGLSALLDSEPGIDVVAEADNGAAAVQLAADLQPDVVVMDLHMPDLDGIQATRQITAASPRIAVLVLTMFDDDDSVFAAMRAGARGYLLKGSNQAEVVRAVLAVGSGAATFGPAVAARVLEYFSRPVKSSAFPQLTDREHEILVLLAEGQGNAAIASRLGITAKTVRNHVSNIFTKLSVADRAHAIIAAREAGLGRG